MGVLPPNWRPVMNDRIWLKTYPPGVPADIDVNRYGSVVEMMEESFQKFANRSAMGIRMPCKSKFKFMKSMKKTILAPEASPTVGIGRGAICPKGGVKC